MSLSERMNEEVERRIDRLRERYGEFPIEEETVENDPVYFEHGVRIAREGWLGESGVWVTDDEGRALFIRHPENPDKWGIPGGTHEGGEAFAETARREVREETGVECEITGVWEATRKTIVHEDDRNRRLYALTVLFEGRVAESATEATAVHDDEILEARWFDEPPEAVHEFVEPKIEEWVGRRQC